ncbi:TorF family putative porin [Sulfurimonas sp.]|nr:TorF family putative porin [Sulfurimonas sp.]
MKSIKLSIVAALLATTSIVSNVSADELEVSANVAMTSNYIWRGMTQSDNAMAIQGGADIGYKGLYAGVWASNVDFDSTENNSIEVDLYFGYANEISGFSYDLGYCQYTYPGDTKGSNFGEAALSLGYDFKVAAVSAKYYLGVDTDEVANDAANGWEPGDGWEVGLSVPLPMDMSIDGTYGSYDNSGTLNQTTNGLGDYYLVGLSKSVGKFDLSLAYTAMDYDSATGGHDGDGKEDNVVFTVGTSF